ncbi:MAG: polysaccharide biosynthesis protein [Flavobacteriaceae bacterium]|nr:polysaccharide biosynthesis protein [Flavobacteriaceae bacterium]
MVLFANLVSYWIISNLTFRHYDTISISQRILILIASQAFFFFVYKTYAGIIRHSTLNDAYKIFLTTFSSFFALSVLNYLHFFAKGTKIFLIPTLLLTFLLSFTFLLAFRMLVKIFFQIFLESNNVLNVQKVVIYGIDSKAIALANALNTEQPRKYKLVGFIDKYKQKGKVTKKLLGVPIVSHKKAINKVLEELGAKALILADSNINIQLENLIVNQCLKYNIKLLKVPAVTDWENEKNISKNIKTFDILDLLNRAPIHLDFSLISNQISNKIVLITGAAGSIGSEIVRQVFTFNPKQIILVDQAESALYDLLNEYHDQSAFIPIIADVRDYQQMEKIFELYFPNYIFHAAAYKHVPLMENNPSQAIFTNVLGSKNLADLAVKFHVERFVMISTDKAVNPSNVMGASKRIAEMYVQALSKKIENKTENGTKFITTRFGNVLGSNGSVVPLFTKQIQEGGPITITHPDIIRYFMTIPEACQLVLEAGSIGNGGEIYIFDMGKPVKILDLAIKMIQLAGLVPYQDIDIKVVGLRPGEKLYEELLNDSSKTLPTYHEKITVAKDESVEYEEINAAVQNLIKIAKEGNSVSIVSFMKEIVPEFLSLNSKYSELDA